MRHAIDHLGVKGSVLVIKDDRPWLNYATANKADTSYLINSVQKSMTASMIMREVQKKKLKLSTKLSKYYSAVPGADQVTVANLLSMTSGLDLRKGTQLGLPTFTSDHENMESNVKKTVFNQKKFGKFHYTSVNYVYLCGILAKVENKDYEDIFRNTFIKPLKLTHTEFLWASPEKLKKSHWVSGYIKDDEDTEYHKVSYNAAVEDAHNELGAGSIVMSNADLAKTMHAILAGKLLTDQSRKVLFKGLAPKYYNGGFYNLPHYKVANGAGAGYYTFFRASNGGRDMIIIQANKTKNGEFYKLRNRVNNIMSIMLGW